MTRANKPAAYPPRIIQNQGSRPVSRPVSRVAWIDYAKGIGIFLVVVGHTLRGLVSGQILATTGWVQAVDQWIYSFHMPLFLMLSGLLIGRSLKHSWLSLWQDKLRTIAYPYAVWALIQSLLQVLASRHTNHADHTDNIQDLWRIVYYPPQHLWFLYILFLIVMLYGGLHYALRALSRLTSSPLEILPNWSKGLFLAGSVLLYILAYGGVNLGPWGMVYLLGYTSVYFALGALLGPRLKFQQPFQDSVERPLGQGGDWLSQLKVPALGLIVLMGYAAVGLNVGLGQAEHPVWLLMAAIAGCLATAALAILLARVQIFQALEVWGHLSLQIYLAHSLTSAVLRIGLQKLLGITHPMLHLVAGIIVGIYGPILLVRLCQRAQFDYLFTWPRRSLRSSQAG